MVEIQKRELTGSPGPHLLIIAGVHGDEFEPMACVRRLMHEVSPESLTGKLTLVPVANEAAFELGTRTAEDGLDLARVCPGREDGSITERTAHALSAVIRTADYFIDLHTGGTALTVWPLAGYKLHANLQVRETQRRMARAFNLPLVWGTDPNLEGRTLSVARDANIPAIYAEYLGGGRFEPDGVTAYVEGCLNVMAELGMLDRPRPDSHIEYEVEDERPSAGHMQICNLSPMTGFFEPAVRVGQRVAEGDLLGVVCDLLGGQRREVRISQNGIVLVLRTFCRVSEGDSLGVILEGVDD
ncbi:MAG: succinylglutamate desuccinylase/aspartoacylase family protein [Pirellulaceae bacterium]